MNSLLIFAFIYLLLLSKVLSATSKECNEVIRTISNKDECLSSRIELKRKMAKISNDSFEFRERMRNKTCTGEIISSIHTSSWVSEIFEGIESHYELFKSDTVPGFKLYSGDNLINLFLEHNATNSRIVYQLKHTGLHKLSWTIEKLPKKGGWVIYQNFDETYTLKAWLSKNTSGFYNATHGEIRMWQTVPDKVNYFIKKSTGYKLDINTLTNLNAPQQTPDLTFLLPYVNFLLTYKEEDVITNFEKAYNEYGSGKILDWVTFNKYIKTLAKLTKYFSENYNSQNTYTREIWDDWVSIHGAPDPNHFPGLTFEQIKALIPEEEFSYQFEVRAVFLGENTDCKFNDVFMNYLTTNSSYLTFGIIIYLFILFIIV